MNINIKFSNKTFYLLIGIIAVLVVTSIAIALNSRDYNVHGHDLSEIPTCADGKILKMVNGNWTCGNDNEGTSGSSVPCNWGDGSQQCHFLLMK